MGGAIFGVGYIIAYIRGLRSEVACKERYIEETDEREKAIQYKASYVGMRIIIAVLIVANLVAGFYSTLVSVVLFGVLAFMGLTIATLIIGYKSSM